MRLQFMKKQIISLLIMLSVVTTVSTFAYWATSVEGTNDSSDMVITIGSAQGAETTLSITPSQVYSLGVLVPKEQLGNSSNPFAVDEINVFHDLLWDEEERDTQTKGTQIEGYISMEYSVEIYPYGSDTALDNNTYSHIYDLLHLSSNELNSNTIVLKDSNAKEMIYTITMDEPQNKTDYTLISQSTIIFTFIYTIDLETSHLSIDFTNSNMDAFMNYSPLSNNIDKWNTTFGSPLSNEISGGESLLLIPINQDEYTLIVTAQLTNPDSTYGGYGILFDTTAGHNASNDSGYIFQFDRGYSRGSMITRERVLGREMNPNWAITADNELFPDKYQDPEWWTAIHEITIEVSNLDETTRTAVFYIDGDFYGSITYEDNITDEQVYVGFRGWSDSPTNYYDIVVK